MTIAHRNPYIRLVHPLLSTCPPKANGETHRRLLVIQQRKQSSGQAPKQRRPLTKMTKGEMTTKKKAALKPRSFIYLLRPPSINSY